MELLVPLDQGCSEWVVFPFCRRMASAQTTRVTVTHIIPPDEPLKPAIVREAETYLCIAAQELKECGVPVERIVRHGDPAVEILNLAEELDATMIVMAARSETVLDHRQLGRVTSDVLAACTRPVVVIKP